MPARVDTDKKQNPWRLAEAAYSEAMLSELKERFGFDALQPEFARELRDMASRYILSRRGEDSDIPDQKRLHREYKALEDAAARFLSVLKEWGKRGIASDMYFAARSLHEPKPQTDFPDLSEHQKTRGEPYYYELVRLLNLLKAGAKRGAQYFSPPPGRPNNFSLQILIMKIADFSEFELHRPFTVDHHQRTGVSEAFKFVRALVDPIDDVSDTQIVKAIRAEIKSRLTCSPEMPRLEVRIHSIEADGR